MKLITCGNTYWANRLTNDFKFYLVHTNQNHDMCINVYR